MTVPREQSSGQNSAYRSSCRNFIFLNPLSGAQHMSAPSRRPEIRRRRARQHKITTLRKRLASAQTDADRNRVTAKLHKLAIASPGQPLLK
jgi:hypothetical protein